MKISEILQKYPIGKIIDGTVVYRTYFGIFLYISDEKILGVVKITDIVDNNLEFIEQGLEYDSMYFIPSFGTILRCCIYGYDDISNQLILTIRPSQMKINTTQHFSLYLESFGFIIGGVYNAEIESYSEKGLIVTLEKMVVGLLFWKDVLNIKCLKVGEIIRIKVKEFNIEDQLAIVVLE